MEYTELIRARYSCKNYDGRPVAHETVEEILNAGRMAPTAKNLQEQKIYVIESADKLAVIDRNTPCRYGAPTVLAVAFNRENVFTYPGGKKTSGVEDAVIVATHLLLAAKNAGVDSCWLNFFDPEKLAKELGLPENEELVMLMDLGYASPAGKPLPNHNARKELQETVEWI